MTTTPRADRAPKRRDGDAGTTPRAARAIGAAMAPCVALVWLSALGVVPDAADAAVADVVMPAVLLMAALLCLIRAGTHTRQRAAWAAMGTGLLLWFMGELSFALLGPEAPGPSLADPLYLGFYPASYAAVLLILREQAGALPRGTWLDGLIAALGTAAIAAALVVPAIGQEPDRLATIVNVAYPIGDVVLLAIVAGVWALLGWRPGVTWALLGAGLALNAYGDAAYVVQSASESYVRGSLLDAVWALAAALVGAAAWARPSERAPRVDLRSWPVLVVPMAFTLASVGLLVYGTSAGTAPVTTGLAAATLLAAVGKMTGSFLEARNFTETRRQAATDDLTGLANRRVFYAGLGEALGRAGGRALAVLMVDLDQFKELNDTLGHHAGDLVLAQMGPRLREALRSDDLLARLGGDEFGILMEGASVQDARTVATRIVEVLEQPFDVAGLTISLQASLGIALHPDHGSDVDLLLQRADVAMYEAKAARSGYEVYTPERDDHTRERLMLMNDLSDAIDSGELTLRFQPKARIPDGEVVGVEALVRWHHPRYGVLAPGRFLHLAERSGLMRRLTARVLDDALEACAGWQRDGLDLRVAVNLSASNVVDTELPGLVSRLLGKHGVAPEKLLLELTEHMVLTDPRRATSVVAQLRDLGVELSLDDFGTGYSSLAYLKRLAVSELKIDRSFVSGVVDDPDDATIVRSTIELAHSLGVQVVAEGIEDRACWDALVAMGCDEGQGWYLSRPLKAADVAACVREHRRLVV